MLTMGEIAEKVHDTFPLDILDEEKLQCLTTDEVIGV